MALTCKNWGVLPRPGGWHDQDYTELYHMNLALRAYQTGQIEKERPDQLTPDDYRFIDWMFQNEPTPVYFG